ncbi:MAG: response regulator, partial [Thermoanaerobaculia bacterium]
FSASSAQWCTCDLKLRTLVCPHCSACFCLAPAPYKGRFWENAPRVLGENTSRFRVIETAEAPGPRRQIRVLIVDDEEAMRSLVACYIEQLGYDVTTVSDPEEALTILESTPFDVVVTDGLMPRMDGRELCLKIKTTMGDKIKVVLMTSLYTANRFKTEARHQFRVDDYLKKPMQFDELKAAMDRVAPL